MKKFIALFVCIMSLSALSPALWTNQLDRYSLLTLKQMIDLGTAPINTKEVWINGTKVVNSSGAWIGAAMTPSTLTFSSTSYTGTITPSGSLTANRAYSIVWPNAATTLTITGSATLNDWFDQAVKAASSPSFAALNVTGASGITAGTAASVAGAIHIANASNAYTIDLTGTAASTSKSIVFPNTAGTVALTSDVTSGIASAEAAKVRYLSVRLNTGAGVSTNYSMILAAPAAITVTHMEIACLAATTGGTATLAITKNAATNMLTGATYDLTALAAKTGAALTIPGTSADTLAAGDTIWATVATGTSATDPGGCVLTVEYTN
jgi:hypothetical protein